MQARKGNLKGKILWKNEEDYDRNYNHDNCAMSQEEAIFYQCENLIVAVTEDAMRVFAKAVRENDDATAE